MRSHDSNDIPRSRSVDTSTKVARCDGHNGRTRLLTKPKSCLAVKMDSCDSPNVEPATCKFTMQGESE